MFIDKEKKIIKDHLDDKAVDRHNNRSSVISSFFIFSEKLSYSKYLKLAVMILLPVMILLRYPVDSLDYDLWWQMALGKYYLTHHTLVIDHSIFSWTPTDHGWIYNTCLGSIILYLIYSMMGGLGLWIFQWLILLGIFLSFYVFLKLIKQPLDITSLTVMAAVGISCSTSLSYYKPELFSPLILSWIAVIFSYFKIKRKIFSLYIYPFIFALWVNLHGAFLLGFCLLGCFFIGEILNRIFSMPESFSMKELFHLGAACVLSALAVLVNPYGINYLLGIYNASMSEVYTVNTRYIQAYVSLWPYLKDLGQSAVSFFNVGQNVLLMSVMILLLASIFLWALMKKKICDFSLLVLTIATFIGSMSVVRTVYMFPLVFFFSFYYLPYRLNLKNISAKVTALSLIIFIILFINISYFTIRYGAGNKWFGAGLESFAPVEEVAFLKKYRLQGKIFNDYVIGGYLLWDLYPDYKVFIDPRHGLYCKQVAPDYWDFVSKSATPESIRRFTQKYPFNIVILRYSELPLIFDFLNADWQLLYFEKNAAILIHKSLLSEIPPGVRNVDLGPMRFKDVKNPEVLLKVFSLYVNFYPQGSRVIYDIYKNNVSDYYKPKREHLKVMESDMRQKDVAL